MQLTKKIDAADDRGSPEDLAADECRMLGGS
jgi:hypothetical protein